MSRYPTDTVTTVADYLAADPDSLVDAVNSYGCSTMWTPLSTAAKAALDSGSAAQARVLWLLADCSSMMLKPASQNSPFGPMCQFDDRRSAMVEDFEPSDLEVLGEVVGLIRNDDLRARVSDILWLARKPRQFQDGLQAAESYSTRLLDHESWYRSSAESFERGIVLCRQLGSAALPILERIEEKLAIGGLASTQAQGLYGVQVFALLLRCQLLRSERNELVVTHLRTLIDGFRGDRDHGRMREAAEVLQNLLGRLNGYEDEIQTLQVSIAESWASQAEDTATPAIASNIAGVSYCNNAIQAFREIPRNKRTSLGVDERILELRSQLAASGIGALDEMGQFESEGIDISDLVKNAISQVEGRSVWNALYGLAHIAQPPSSEEIRQRVIELSQEYPLGTLFGATHLSRDGRVVARTDGGNFGVLEGHELLIEMIKNFQISVDLSVQGAIWPGLRAVRNEHRLTSAEFTYIASNAPIVPRGSAWLIGEALYLGYDDNWIAATHLIAPQIESLIRLHLKSAGCTTTSVDRDGIENEIGLSSLLGLDEAASVIGEDMIFELKAMFTTPPGPNFRNEIAHGLVSADKCASASALYAWWVLFRIVMDSFASTQQQNDELDVND